MNFLSECVLAGANTEIRINTKKRIVDMNHLDIDIYFWKYYHVKEYDGIWLLDKETPYYKLIAEVRFENVNCRCGQNYQESIHSDRREGHPTIESMISLWEEMMDLLKTLKFDKLTGTFTMNETCEIVEECCVCLEMTKTKTNCGHHMCISCWNQVLDGRCPICRVYHIYLNCPDLLNINDMRGTQTKQTLL